MKCVTSLTMIGKLPIILFFLAKHTDHSISIHPAVIFVSIMALIAAVMLITTRRDHPICYISKVITFIRNLHVPFSNFAQFFNNLRSFGVFTHKRDFDLRCWNIRKVVYGLNIRDILDIA